MRIGTIEVGVGAALAPMAGVTDLAFRAVCAEQGACLTVTEMVSAKALHYGDKKSAALLKKTPGCICGAQIFGSDPEIMAEGARLAWELSGCDFIDLNMGCPMPKIVNNGEGAALMKNLPLAGEIIRAVCAAVPVPVTVKTRKGWDRGSVNVVQLAEIAEQNGAAAITVHGRTKTMLYSGTADWDIIREVQRAVTIPVVANGDVHDAASALRCLDRSQASAVAVGRAAFGDPWLFAEIKAALEGRPVPQRPPLRERLDLALRQFELALTDKGEHIACLEARKHFAWYLRGVTNSNVWKDRISRIASADEARSTIEKMQRELR